MGITKPCTLLHQAPSTSHQLHSAPSTSSQLISTSIQLHQPPPSSFQTPPRSLQHRQRCTRYLGRVDSKFRLRFLKFLPQNPFLDKLGPKMSKLFVLPKNWYTWYLEDADSYSNIIFLNFQPRIHFMANLGQKSQSYPFCLKIDTRGILRMLVQH